MLVIGKGVVDWVAKQTNEYGNFGTDIGIGWQKNGEIVAGVAYANWNGPNIECHIASDKSRKWLTKQYLFAIFWYPFVQLDCRRITVCVGSGNKDSIRFVKHLGFQLEATLENAHPTGDILIFRLLKEECRFIRKVYTCEKMAA